MSRCNYNSKRLIPCPFVTLSKEFERTPDGTLIGSRWKGTIIGTIVTHKGSPNSSGVFWTIGGYPPDEIVALDSRLGVIFRKQEAIRELFSEDGHSLEFQSADGSAPMKCNPIITNIRFQEDKWVDYCDYTIDFEADIIYVNGEEYGEDEFVAYINSAEDSWQLEQGDEQETIGQYIYRLTHTVNATGKLVYNDAGDLIKPAWEQARDWVQTRIGISNYMGPSSGVIHLPTYQGYNHVRSENIGELNGEYSVTETWVLASGIAYEDFNLSIRKSQDNPYIGVTIDGTINGLEVRNNDMHVTTTKYSNANTFFNSVSGSILTRAQNYAGTDLNVLPLTETIGRNPYQGTITYSYEYNTRPSNLISGAISEVISVQDYNGVDVIAIVPILGRQYGPILQDINTKREKTRTLTIEVVVRPSSGTILERYNSMPSGQAEEIAEMLKPAGLQVYVTDNNYNFDITNGRYSLNRQWTYED